MIPSKPPTMLEQHPHVADTLRGLRAGAYFLLPECLGCRKRNEIRGALREEWADVDTYPYAFVRRCVCVQGAALSPLTEDAVIGMVRRLVVPTPPPNPPVAASPAPAEELTRPNTSHLFFDADIVGCSVCGGTEPFTFKVRQAFPTVLRALQVIADRHPMTPHALSASL